MCSNQLTAQDYPDVSSMAQKGKWSVRLSFLDIIDAAGSLPIGVEYRFNERLSLGLETGILSSKLSILPGEISNTSPRFGIKNRVELKLYNVKRRTSYTKSYWSIELTQKYYEQTLDRWFCRLGCLYDERIEYTRKHTALAAHLKLGGIQDLGQKFYLEYSAGMGPRLIQRTDDDLPTDVISLDQTPFEIRPGNYITPSIIASLKIGYFIN